MSVPHYSLHSDLRTIALGVIVFLMFVPTLSHSSILGHASKEHKGSKPLSETVQRRLELLVRGQQGVQSNTKSNSWTDEIVGDSTLTPGANDGNTSLTPDNLAEFLASPTSRKGYNQQAYSQYVFNEEFAVKECQEADMEAYEQVQDELRNLSIAARQNELTPQGLSKWYPVARALWWTFYEESGTLAYVDSDEYVGWIFCGCVNLKNTFVNESSHFRMCAPLDSVGLKNISRDPIEGCDYLKENDLSFSTFSFSASAMRSTNRVTREPSTYSRKKDHMSNGIKTLPEYDYTSALDGSLSGECKYPITPKSKSLEFVREGELCQLCLSFSRLMFTNSIIFLTHHTLT